MTWEWVVLILGLVYATCLIVALEVLKSRVVHTKSPFGEKTVSFRFKGDMEVPE